MICKYDQNTKDGGDAKFDVWLIILDMSGQYDDIFRFSIDTAFICFNNYLI